MAKIKKKQNSNELGGKIKFRSVKMANSREKSDILLICVTPGYGELPKHPSLADLFSLFSPVARPWKLIVFSRKLVFKAFAQFENQASAGRVFRRYNGKVLAGFGRARIYYSELQELNNSNEFLEFWQDLGGGAPQPSLSLQCLASPGHEKVDFEGARGRVGSIGSSGSNSDNSTFFPSPVVLVSNLSAELESARELLNLFGCFGRLRRVLVMRNLRKALLEFEEQAQACRAVAEFSLAKFSKLKLKANFSRYREVDLTRGQVSANSIAFNEAMEPPALQHRADEPVQRLSNSVEINFGNPSGNLKPLDVYVAVSELAEAKNIKILRESPQDNLILFEFSSLDQAVIVLAKLHCSSIKNTHLHINFSSL